MFSWLPLFIFNACFGVYYYRFYHCNATAFKSWFGCTFLTYCSMNTQHSMLCFVVLWYSKSNELFYCGPHTGGREIHIHELPRDLRERGSVHSTSRGCRCPGHVTRRSSAACRARPPPCWTRQSAKPHSKLRRQSINQSADFYSGLSGATTCKDH